MAHIDKYLLAGPGHLLGCGTSTVLIKPILNPLCKNKSVIEHVSVLNIQLV